MYGVYTTCQFQIVFNMFICFISIVLSNNSLNSADRSLNNDQTNKTLLLRNCPSLRGLLVVHFRKLFELILTFHVTYLIISKDSITKFFNVPKKYNNYLFL